MSRKLWNKLESTSYTSEAGPNAVDTGDPTYTAAKWGNGVKCSAATQGVTFSPIPNDFSSMQVYKTHFYVNPEFNVNSGVAAVAGSFFIMGLSSDASHFIQFYISSGADKTDMAIFNGGWQEFKMNAYDLVAGTWNHFEVVVDKGGIGGGANKIALYVNGTLYFSSATTPNAMTDGNYKIVLGNYMGFGQSNRMWFDNFVLDDSAVYSDNDKDYESGTAPSGRRRIFVTFN